MVQSGQPIVVTASVKVTKSGTDQVVDKGFTRNGGLMTDVTVRTICYFRSTPKDLREIADKMEKHWRKSLPGDDLTSHIWFGTNCELRFIIDQNLMP